MVPLWTSTAALQKIHFLKSDLYFVKPYLFVGIRVQCHIPSEKLGSGEPEKKSVTQQLCCWGMFASCCLQPWRQDSQIGWTVGG